MSFRDKIGNQFTVTVELDYGKAVGAKRYVEDAVRIDADAFNVAESPLGKLRTSPIAIASELAKAGREPIAHFTCRDRTLLSMHSDLLGAHVLGVHNLLALTGDTAKSGDFPGTGVFSVDVLGLLKVISQLNEGKDHNGRVLPVKTDFFAGGAVDPANPNFERMKKKIDAGARFFQTQPVFDASVGERFLSAAADLGAPVLIGVLPLKSYEMAQRINTIPGMAIPDSVMKRMKEDPTADTGVQIAIEIIEALNPERGIHIMPLGSADAAQEIIKSVK